MKLPTVHTSFWTIEGRWARSIRTVWNISTTPS